MQNISQSSCTLGSLHFAMTAVEGEQLQKPRIVTRHSAIALHSSMHKTNDPAIHGAALPLKTSL